MQNKTFNRIEHIIAEKRDALLINATLAGDSKSFSKLMSLYKRRITLLGMGFFKNETETEDFVQDVFIRVYGRLSTFEGKSSFATWLTKIAYNIAINTINRRKEYLSLANEESLTAGNLTPEEENIKECVRQAVRDAVKELPEKYTLCLDLYFFHDLSYEEISKITNFPVNTIKSHIFRAKKILREKLRGFYES